MVILEYRLPNRQHPVPDIRTPIYSTTVYGRCSLRSLHLRKNLSYSFNLSGAGRPIPRLPSESPPVRPHGKQIVQKNTTPFHLIYRTQQSNTMLKLSRVWEQRSDAFNEWPDKYRSNWHFNLAKKIAHGFRRVIPTRVFKIIKPDVVSLVDQRVVKSKIGRGETTMHSL